MALRLPPLASIGSIVRISGGFLELISAFTRTLALACLGIIAYRSYLRMVLGYEWGGACECAE